MLANCGGIGVVEHYFSDFDLLFAELDDVALFERISLGAVKSTWFGNQPEQFLQSLLLVVDIDRHNFIVVGSPDHLERCIFEHLYQHASTSSLTPFYPISRIVFFSRP